MAHRTSRAHGAGPGPDGFARFRTRHRDHLHRVLAMSLGDPVLSAAAVDAALARAGRRWGQVASLDNPAGWVYQVARSWARAQAPAHGTGFGSNRGSLTGAGCGGSSRPAAPHR
jgi:hypothetical protein